MGGGRWQSGECLWNINCAFLSIPLQFEGSAYSAEGLASCCKERLLALSQHPSRAVVLHGRHHPPKRILKARTQLSGHCLVFGDEFPPMQTPFERILTRKACPMEIQKEPENTCGRPLSILGLNTNQDLSF